MFILHYAIQYAMPISAALLLIVFFSGLPPLERCRLPRDCPGRRLSAKDDGRRLTIKDAGLVLLLTALYALLAFRALGDSRAPQSFVDMGGNSARITLEGDAAPSRVLLYPGVGTGSYQIEYSEDGLSYQSVLSFRQSYTEVLKWQFLTPETELRPRTVRISCISGTPWLGEVVLLDGDGAAIPIRCTIAELCDEQDCFPRAQSFMNSSYFDEIYHVRTAWEQLQGLWPYELSHPPLGKTLIGLGIRLLGMSPFGWRFMGTLCGVLMLPVMYVFIKRLFGGTAVPCLGTLLLASDFLHYVQTRIATVDSYPVFFILCVYLCLYDYCRREKPLSLALCGLSFGLGCACKWICLYAGAGLGLIWVSHWAFRFLDALRSEQPQLRRHFAKHVLLALLFLVLLPGLIYYLSYLPYGQAGGAALFSKEYTQIVLDNQSFMFSYHSNVSAKHPFASRWYQWVLNIRPIQYYLHHFGDGTRSSICALLNPALCWGGILSLFVLLYTAIFRRDKKAAFILVGYFSQLVPWMFIKRPTFEYHYFAASLFLVLMLCYVFSLMRDNFRGWLRFALPFTLVSVLLFALFFPALSGDRVNTARATELMRWLPTWPL